MKDALIQVYYTNILVKSNEEIEKLCTPDYNNFIDKCVHLLNTGQAF